MPSFRDTALSEAPPEEVWKLLYDPARFPEWWAGIAAVEVEAHAGGEDRGFSYHPEGASGPPLPQRLETSSDERRIVVSCLVYDFRFEWRLEPAGDGEATRIEVLVDVPAEQSASFDSLREGIGRSIVLLAERAARP